MAMCRLMFRLFLFVLLHSTFISSTDTVLSAPVQLYVVPFPSVLNDTNDGSRAHPYSSLQQALDHIEHEYHRNMNSVERKTIINLYPTYHFVNTIHFNQAHSHTQLTTMNSADADFYTKLLVQEPTHQRLSTATISGGILVTGWTQVSTNTYSAVVPSSIFVNQLFIDNRRIVRTRVPSNYSGYLQYEAPLNNTAQARYGFQYAPGQFNYKSLADTMVVVYHSWTTSHHYIDHLITTNNTIIFTNPSDRPIGSFVIQGQRRFHIENLCEALVPNSFCFVNETKTVYLMTDGSYDPTKSQIITPVNETVLLIASDDVTKPVEDVTMNNVAIQHGAWNIGRTQQADQFSAAFITSAALFIANATSIMISDIEVSHTGLYGLWIKEGTTDITVINSLVTDTGAGGIRIGQMISPVPTPTTSINIMSNEVSYGGNVFPSGVGINTHRAMDVAIVDNHVHHHRYSGIVVGWQLGYSPSLTGNILVQGNYVHDIGQHILCDQGGIYTLGIQYGTIIHGNVIKNVYSYAVYMWGIYLDEGSSDLIVSNNLVYNTGWASLFLHYGANNTIINNVFARGASIQPPQPGDPYPDADVRIQEAENHTSWTFTRNIIYDTYQGTNHTVFTSYPMVIAPFSDNVYYSLYNTSLLFGWQQLSFDEWQKSGHDNGSVMADPLFAGDVNQCDFFTVRANSPAAQLGFRNLTKISKWTPGCDTSTGSDHMQFYHW